MLLTHSQAVFSFPYPNPYPYLSVQFPHIHVLKGLLQNNDIIDRVSLLTSHPFPEIADRASALEAQFEGLVGCDDALL